MTIQKALDLADQLKPNMMTKPAKIGFLNEIENMIWQELVMTHEHTDAEETRPDYDTETDPGTELIIPVPYDMLYVYWIMSQIDHMNQEIDKYNNDMNLFQNKYEEASDWWTRQRMPLQKTREFRL